MQVTKWIREEDSSQYMEATIAADQAVISDIQANLYCFTGECQQYKFQLLPVIDDKFVFTATWRYWGQLMAFAWNAILSQGRYDYLSFYMLDFFPSSLELKYPAASD